ncbi:hypothetical protein [Catenuloplanes atrovinosus]|uniref:Uncharacterized protein n=1 Tax=Catenuloplanes atrovinosus TaxID=137266 RepID=A0AAE4CD64_9ACTN|nr:hypothetical protein [Catenuloplanes atrovinosus]MDR7280032.1 hypothetical protein [Catenuloplanes atrovinosus]
MGYDAPSPALAGSERAHPLAVVLVAVAGVVAAGVFGAVVVRFAGADSRAADRLTGPPPAQVAAAPTSPSPSPSPSPASPSPAAVADECLVGPWRVAEQRELVALPDLGTVEVTLTGVGPAVTYRADGTGVIEYGEATSYAATVDGRDALITVAGTVTFEFGAADGVTAATEARSDATFTVTPDGAEPGAPADWPASLTEWSYECGPSDLALTGPDAQREVLTRGE